MRCFSIVVLLLAGCGARTGFLDVGEEAPRIDAGVPECVEDAVCDDGVACTRDRCEAGRCVVEADDVACEDGLFCTGPGRCEAAMGCVYDRPPCADGLECTEDVCDEAARSCENVPDARFCPLSFRCDADMGCVPRALVHVDDALWEVDLPSGDLHFLVRMRTTLSDIALGGDGTKRPIAQQHRRIQPARLLDGGNKLSARREALLLERPVERSAARLLG